MEIILTAHICILMGFVKLSRLQMDLILHHSMILEEEPMSKGDLDKYVIFFTRKRDLFWDRFKYTGCSKNFAVFVTPRRHYKLQW